MAQFKLPTEPDFRNYSFRVSLDGETYELLVIWNVRDEAFYCSVFEADGTAVIQGRKLSSTTFPLSGISLASKPAGELYILDTESLARPPQIGELGTIFELIYLDEEEIDSL